MRDRKSVYIIAEAGVNHNGSIEIARKLVDKAKWAGVDAVKFQLFKSEEMTSFFANKAEYQKEGTDAVESQLEMLKKLELAYEKQRKLKEYCDSIGIEFLTSPFDIKSVDETADMGLSYIKIPSGEITNKPYLRRIAQKNIDMILSTGMSDILDVQNAIEILEKSEGEIILLHCNTEYPTPMEDVNLNAMLTLGEEFHKVIGYSDHTCGIEVPIAAVAMGAKIIEKHFTLDKNMEGPDHKASLNPRELKDMVCGIRNIEKALGNGEKKPSISERKNIKIARKSIVAGKEIKAGDLFTEDNLACKRPGEGISPMKWDDIIGRKATKCYHQDQCIDKDEIL